MRKLLLSLLLIAVIPLSLHGKEKSWFSVYNQVLNDHVVLMDSEWSFCTAFKVEKELFLTANHCNAEKEPDAHLVDQFGLHYLYSVIKTDPHLDLALLKAQVPTKTPIKFADSLTEGTPVMAVGYSMVFRDISPSSIQGNVIGLYANYLLVVNHLFKKGYSGGPLVNFNGEVVGLNVMMEPDAGIGFSVAGPVLQYFLYEE